MCKMMTNQALLFIPYYCWLREEFQSDKVSRSNKWISILGENDAHLESKHL